MIHSSYISSTRCCMLLARRHMTSSSASSLLEELRALDVACLCDADKILLASNKDDYAYKGLRLMNNSIRTIAGQGTMVGIVRTVQCTKRNDFLAVLRGLLDAHAGDVLVVNTSDSTRAVLGELFATEAYHRRGLAGLIVDGPVRDTNHLRKLKLDAFSTFRVYASSVTPYAGTTQSPGTMQTIVTCGGVSVHPGDIVVGDDDGVVVGSPACFAKLLPVAQEIDQVETTLRERLVAANGESLETLTNAPEHIRLRLAQEESSLEFRV
jgi:4-hydroxy-4-methyl-2-oxoglutarate aldolase